MSCFMVFKKKKLNQIKKKKMEQRKVKIEKYLKKKN